MQVQEVVTTDVHWGTTEDSAQKAAQLMKTADTGVIPIVQGDNRTPSE